MKITLAMVESADGKITYGDSPKIHNWTSKEDQQHFAKMVEQANLIVAGSKTYDSAKKMMKLQAGKLRVILTRDPSKYADQIVPGQLEFTSETPQALTDRLEKQGYNEMLLAGGGEINGLFFDAGLVDELLLTVEPKLLGNGKSITTQKNISSMKLISVEKLNDQGTLLLKYQIEK
jgi:dihydrofolate reductase